MTPEMFLSFMIINEMAWTFDESVRIDVSYMMLKTICLKQKPDTNVCFYLNLFLKLNVQFYSD